MYNETRTERKPSISEQKNDILEEPLSKQRCLGDK